MNPIYSFIGTKNLVLEKSNIVIYMLTFMKDFGSEPNTVTRMPRESKGEISLAHEEMILIKLHELVTLLVNGEYDLIVSRGENGRLTKEEIIFAIEDYGGKPFFPTEEDFKSAIIIQVGRTSEYVVEYELWFDNQKSDLTLSATVNTQEDSIAIDNIHVM
ncbi:hypothetical protein H1230_29930 [Paenibacillus sp. 19GGS1-52]|uniref:DUF7668 domain-containing protein n=1 Tax=Paenibacillus sp. 19GGS1-52 TaxID=2758563 RepID=UPI001EFC0277|nr:hypothetical protein [Paenibacillus sp. 19GGS1-52]ULO07111.1 hypothetical protein H1230_29930 [Paenibacillus sp. 19GGS1-52]